MAKGTIYLMTSAVSGLIKIGKTDTAHFEQRMNYLQNNGYFNVTNLRKYFAIEVADYDRKEQLLHTIFSKSQVGSSEMFALDKRIARDLLLAFNGRIIYDAENGGKPKQEKTVKQGRKKAAGSEKPAERSRKHPSEPFRFSMIGLKPGDNIHFVRDESVTAVVASDRTVMYHDQEYSLSHLAQTLLNTEHPVQGPKFFTFNGKKLTELRHNGGK